MGTWVDFNVVKQAVSIEQVLDRYGLKLKRTGKELHGRCPIHQGRGEESFRANTDKNAFQCFSCKAKGNVLDFVAAMEKCTVREAALKIQDWFRVAGSNDAEHSVGSATQTGSELAREEKMGEANCATDKGENSQQIGPNKPLGFQLKGIDHDHPYLTSRGISKETAEHFGVGYFSGKGSMSGRVVIPIHNDADELVAYAGRAIDNTEPKYKLPVGFHKSAELYNLHRAKAAQEQYTHRGLIVVEGFFDAMKVHQAGYPWVVALMGCSMSEEQENVLVSSSDMVIVMLDGDEAGRKGMEDISWRLSRHLWTRVAWLPDGIQPDQLTPEQLCEVL